jgi:DNA-binding transcriptional LysR family regulator
MNSDDLALFARVAQAGSISRAALDLGADQSTLSRRIAQLEAELGGRLFHRSGRGVTVTERGRQLLAYAETVERTLDEAGRAMRDAAQLGPARLCVAAQPTIAQTLFGRLGRELKSAFPLMQLRFIDGLASHLLARLDDGEVDLAILYLPERHAGLRHDPLLSEDIHLVTPADYPLAGEVLAASEFGEHPLILPSTPHGLRLLAESLAARHGFALNIALECDGSISLTKRLVAEHGVCTILPAAAVIEEVAAGKLKTFRFDPPIARDIAIVWPRKGLLAEDLGKVTRIIRHCAAGLMADGAWPDVRAIP